MGIKIKMTIYTNRNDIKIMFRRITKMMMVMCCLFAATITFKYFGRRNFSFPNSVLYAFSGFNFLWVFVSISFYSFFAFFTSQIFSNCFFAFFTLLKMFSVCFSLFALEILFGFNAILFCLLVSFYAGDIAFFTFRTIAKVYSGFSFVVFVKFREWFDFVATRTSFCYNLARHCFLHNRKLCLEPKTDTMSVLGSFYYRYLQNNVNNYFQKIEYFSTRSF